MVIAVTTLAAATFGPVCRASLCAKTEYATYGDEKVVIGQTKL